MELIKDETEASEDGSLCILKSNTARHTTKCSDNERKERRRKINKNIKGKEDTGGEV